MLLLTSVTLFGKSEAILELDPPSSHVSLSSEFFFSLQRTKSFCTYLTKKHKPGGEEKAGSKIWKELMISINFTENECMYNHFEREQYLVMEVESRIIFMHDPIGPDYIRNTTLIENQRLFFSNFLPCAQNPDYAIITSEFPVPCLSSPFSLLTIGVLVIARRKEVPHCIIWLNFWKPCRINMIISWLIRKNNEQRYTYTYLNSTRQFPRLRIAHINLGNYGDFVIIATHHF